MIHMSLVDLFCKLTVIIIPSLRVFKKGMNYEDELVYYRYQILTTKS